MDSLFHEYNTLCTHTPVNHIHVPREIYCNHSCNPFILHSPPKPYLIPGYFHLYLPSNFDFNNIKFVELLLLPVLLLLSSSSSNPNKKKGTWSRTRKTWAHKIILESLGFNLRMSSYIMFGNHVRDTFLTLFLFCFWPWGKLSSDHSASSIWQCFWKSSFLTLIQALSIFSWS